MKKFILYAGIQFKRTFQVFPFMLIMTLLLSGAVLLMIWMQLYMQENDPDNQKLILGIVGENDAEYRGFGLYAIQHLDSSRFELEIQRLSGDEARAELTDRKINAYIVLPDGFMQSVVEGRNLPVKFVINDTGAAAGIVAELTDSVSAVITESQAGVFSMQECYLKHGFESEMYSDSEKLNLSYFDLIMGRDELYDVVKTDETDETPAAGWEEYYLCAGMLVFMMLWGMNGAVLFVRGDNSLYKLLGTRGISALQQCAGELLAYYISAALLFGLIYTAASSAVTGISAFSPALVLAPLCIAAMQYLMFSLVSRLIEGLILNFTVSVALGYVSGCFYPESVFPESIQILSSVLPTGAVMKMMLGQAAGGVPAWSVTAAAGWSAVFFAVSVMIRHLKKINFFC